jgi:GNAT superfamily N-acetyltransferase
VVDDAPVIARLWMEGILASAEASAEFAPGVGVDEYARRVANDLGAGRTTGWGVDGEADGRRVLVAYLTAESREANPVYATRRAHLYLLDLDVLEAFRRRGFGTALVRSAIAHATERDLGPTQVGWIPSDPVASRFWAGLGFKPNFVRATHVPA